MTEPVTKKDNTIEEHGEVNAAKKVPTTQTSKKSSSDLDEDEGEEEEADEDDEGSQAQKSSAAQKNQEYKNGK